ncbi:MAG TPA: amidohydrolase family protein, partial [Blastocatellia bacterium]|nr:amidohydrolase family protein [Blastocatellia bacterium]
MTKKTLGLGVLLFALLGSGFKQQPDFDLLIRNGRVVDGTGNPSFIADVGIREGKIAAIGQLSGRKAARTIDAAGLVVAPGFIDIHNHSDDTILEDGNAESMVRQGVTTMIFGEGGSAAPSEKWKDFAAYYAELLRRGISTNVGSYVGSSSVWTTVHGNQGGTATAEELKQMRAVVRQAME